MVPDVLILTQDTYYKKVAWFGAGPSQRVSFFRFFIFDYLLLPLLPERMQRNI